MIDIINSVQTTYRVKMATSQTDTSRSKSSPPSPDSSQKTTPTNASKRIKLYPLKYMLDSSPQNTKYSACRSSKPLLDNYQRTTRNELRSRNM